MTRPTRKDDEVWAAGLLVAHLASEGIGWHEAADGPTDAPDLVLVNSAAQRVACEITQVGITEWFRWQHLTEAPELQVLHEIRVPRETDVWLSNAIADKAPKAKGYVAAVAASEAWLLVHGGLDPVYDFFNLDEQEGYDIPLLIAAAEAIAHPFTRIFVASASTQRVVQVHPFNGVAPPPPDISLESILKVLVIRGLAIQTQRGVSEVRLGEQFAPGESLHLRPLRPERLRPPVP